MFLLCTVLLILLSASVNVKGNVPRGLPNGLQSTRWEDSDECSLLCGGWGFKEQKKETYMYRHGYRVQLMSTEFRNTTCVTELCGDRCLYTSFIPHPNNPTRFYQCAYNQAVLHRCPKTTVWSQEKSYCDYP